MHRIKRMSRKGLALVLASFLALGSTSAAAADFGDGEFLQDADLSPQSAPGSYDFDAPIEDSAQFEDSDAEIFASPEEENVFDDESGEEENAEGIRYIKGRPLTPEEEAEQMAPFRNLVTMPAEEPVDGSVTISSRTRAAYPERFDARELNNVTIPKNQNPFGICWAFSLASCMETSLLMQGAGAYDLSEEHLAYFMSNRQNDPLGNTPKDRNVYVGQASSPEQGYHAGGHNLAGAIHLSTWSGMTTEDKVPLPTDESHKQVFDTYPDKSGAYDTTAYMKDAAFAAYYSGSTPKIEQTKELITRYHSVAISLYMVDSYLNADTSAYSYPTAGTAINHSVTLVGWDDNYSAANFKDRSKVTQNGAWIVKNSWGPDWGDEGYFYLSYYCKTLTNLVSTEAELYPSYTNNYFYDGTGGPRYTSLAPGASAANIFTAKAGQGKAEVLGEVVTTTFSHRSNLEIQVYTNLKDETDPTSGTPAYAKPVPYYQEIMGIATISIPEVTLIQGSKYSVVITNAGTTSLSYGVEKNTQFPENNIGTWMRFYAGLNKNQSFLRSASNAAWRDAYNDQMCYRIKARTRTLDGKITPKLTVKASKDTIAVKSTASLTPAVTPSSVSNIRLSYTSSNSKVAKVNSSGVITGIAPGTAVITCKSADATNLKASVTITVRPLPPSSVKAARADYDQIKITWSKVSGASGYVLYRSTDGKNYSKLATAVSTAVSYIDKKAVPGVKYTYKIRSYTKIKEKNYYSLTYSNTYSAKASLSKPSFTVTKSGSARTVTWKKVSGAQGYRIYYRLPGKSWTRMKEIKGNSVLTYKKTGLSSSKTYEFCVKAYRVVNNKRVYSAYNIVKK